MLKWLLALLITVIVAGVFLPWLSARLKFGRLPGDFSLRVRGRAYSFPFASALLLSLIATLLLYLL